MKAIGIGEITGIPILDLVTGQPRGGTFPAEELLIWLICTLAELRGFDWRACLAKLQTAVVAGCSVV